MNQNQIPTWVYIRNVFDNVTKGNDKRMLMMGRDHRDKLAAVQNDPNLQPIYQQINTLFQNFESKYEDVGVNFAQYQGNTQILQGYMQTLSSLKIRQWDIWIQNVFLDDTPQYKMLLPEGRSPFQKGAYELRISSIAKLSKSLAPYSAQLGNVIADVDAFLANINDARTTQQGSEQMDNNLRQQLEEARYALALGMHKTLGYLVYLYADNPAKIVSFYELQYVQAPTYAKSATNTNEIEVIANTVQKVETGNYNNNNTFELSNTGTIPLGFFLSNSETAAIPNDLTVLTPGISQTFTFAELTDGNPATMVLVVNNTLDNGKCEMKVH